MILSTRYYQVHWTPPPPPREQLNEVAKFNADSVWVLFVILAPSILGSLCSPLFISTTADPSEEVQEEVITNKAVRLDAKVGVPCSFTEILRVWTDLRVPKGVNPVAVGAIQVELILGEFQRRDVEQVRSPGEVQVREAGEVHRMADVVEILLRSSLVSDGHIPS
jgi:hypothetical protein